MTWISIKDELPPNDGSLIYEYDGIYTPLLNHASTTLRHIHHDIRALGYARATHWAYKDTVEDTEGNVTEPGSEVQEEEVEGHTAENERDEEYEPVSPWFRDYEKRRKESETKPEAWTSENGKWTVEFSGENKGSLVDNKSGKIYLWEYENGGIEVIGTKIPKYIDRKIKELSHV